MTPDSPTCDACDGEGEWFRYEGEGDAHTVICDACNGTGVNPDAVENFDPLHDAFLGGPMTDSRPLSEPWLVRCCGRKMTVPDWEHHAYESGECTYSPYDSEGRYIPVSERGSR